MSDLVREDPPSLAPGGNAKYCAKYAAELEKVRSEPGEWFRLMDFSDRSQGGSPQAHKAATTLRHQVTGYEVRASTGKVYVRWIGGDGGA